MNPEDASFEDVSIQLAELGGVFGYIVDLFCGGGGFSEGIRQALGVSPGMAVNHDPAAIAMHKANHPETAHFCRDVWKAGSWRLLKGRGRRKPVVHLLVLAPDCTHHSRARGGKPRQKNLRDLAWVGVHWARDVRPHVIILENVPEFETWCELDADGRIPADRRGETFQQFVTQLRMLGYVVEWRNLTACDYGAPTSRTRLILVARCDGKPIVWPEPTHGPGRAQPYRTAAECIDWDIPCPSIFLSPEESKTWAREHGAAHGMRAPKRPLADNTLRRIAAGIERFVLKEEEPFLLNLTHGGRLEPLGEPMRTITAAHRGEKALVSPVIARIGHTSSSPKVYDTRQPLTTITSKNEHILVAPTLIHHRGQSVGRRADEPCPTITATGMGHLGIVAPTLIQCGYGERDGQRPRYLDLHRPLGTIPAANKFGLVAALVTKHNGGATGQSPSEPLHTITSRDQKAVTAAWLMKYYGTGLGQSPAAPLDTITSKARFGLVSALMHRFCGRADKGVVTLEIGGETYAIADIGMRMLAPRELARAQGFDDDTILTGTKTQQVARIGRSVPPPLVAAVVGAQFPEAAASVRRSA